MTNAAIGWLSAVAGSPSSAWATPVDEGYYGGGQDALRKPVPEMQALARALAQSSDSRLTAVSTLLADSVAPIAAYERSPDRGLGFWVELGDNRDLQVKVGYYGDDGFEVLLGPYKDDRALERRREWARTEQSWLLDPDTLQA
jgi:hypothetical protein